jgi:hypothetical protein
MSGIKLVGFTCIVEVDEIPEGDDHQYATAVLEKLKKSALDEIDHYVDVFK